MDDLDHIGLVNLATRAALCASASARDGDVATFVVALRASGFIQLGSEENREDNRPD